MDDVQNRFARELADAIATAVAQSAEVESCRERARAAGFDLKVTLEATVGFASRGEDAPENGEPPAGRGRAAATWRSPPTTAGSCARCASPPTRSRSRKRADAEERPRG